MTPGMTLTLFLSPLLLQLDLNFHQILSDNRIWEYFFGLLLEFRKIGISRAEMSQN